MTDVLEVRNVAVPSRSKALHVSLWIAQLLLAAVFLMAGGVKLTAPIEQLQAQMAWVAGSLGPAARFIGLMEVLGGLGLLLPAATRILPFLTPLAAVGLTTVMTLATLTHAVRGEFSLIPVTLTLGAIAAFITWGRFRAAPIGARR